MTVSPDLRISQELSFLPKKTYHSQVVGKKPTIIIIFGATGDLITKKIAPALFHLWAKNRLPQKLKVVGFSRRALTDEKFQEYIQGLVKKDSHIKFSKKTLDSYLQLFSYQQGNFSVKEDYLTLEEYLERLENDWQEKANKLFYLAVPPTLYEGIFEHLSSTKIAREQKGTWNRIVVEKPFGNDLRTAEKLDEILGKLFSEEQIYRIDHYLGKDLLQNILAFRFSNNLLEHGWNNKLIESIEIHLNESSGIEDDRGDSYDPVGALRDVGQNHLLQMLALVTMDNPINFSAKQIRQNRAKIIETLKPFTLQEVKRQTFRGQYEGYRKVKNVPDYSQTETYFKITGELKSPRWKGVSFVLESGKKLPSQRKEIVVTFKQTGGRKNKVVFSLEPREKITILFWAKKPGLDMEIEEREFDFSYRREHEQDEEQTAAYEKLLLDCLTGDQTLFVSTEEVRAMWRFIDPIIRAWQENKVPLEIHKQRETPANKITRVRR
ncbi:MAG: glucose-6-phosphate dehydrogenase [Candidatus Blackburnbacteria bacterium RIFCSPLOWO2_01_FULL_41_27]|uniref:Glucose-6-phosphate 1-dehydrogenase n=2 Tax=Candidatus Blackburniibacteriota TaxID=1817898 RepID=A0A1G1V9W7_9BACT|nr:MAG: glucose-6-phosphate dehydrogenase [Candidatus Blackburnbacteria bacterium RIFCSPHIGHO2_12_FULL_41_13b]OGY13369.1 MAG: glucose-6-phosphate dehydrogenase [Candidatus Blackburnbacteria bacterium RIFCSPLOWO2_01_FULL_41_27]